ncbi:hypothetical protein JDV02_003163 [Purpureocillium takamizusanense]|uniref:Uncharacterized protein n=1 Tax=Purpureocillium takamizusanense TaxID=2060973 RepID=A0A9Q8QBV9_9HYPO|nr:uncharacterized protein JDV02_003163 [Purpureocillium takamizusanense]UNI16755.1 hypothetical protein JDV02_003163 [Purpureocillium takamizusanense]
MKNSAAALLLLALAAAVSATCNKEPVLNTIGTCSKETNLCTLSKNGKQWTKSCEPKCSRTDSDCIDNMSDKTAYCL